MKAVERAAVAEEVASLLRHDLRNKLASVRQAASYLSKKARGSELWASDKRFALFFQLIHDEIDAADRLVGERMQLQHVFGRGAAPVLVGDAVRHAVAELHGGVEVATDLADTVCVHADPDEIALLVGCLLDNALEAGAGLVRVRTSDAAGAVVLAVEDDGTGASPDFQAFRSTKPGHTGLGLPIVQRITTRYGGSLRIESDNSGTSVIVRLPVASF